MPTSTNDRNSWFIRKAITNTAAAIATKNSVVIRPANGRATESGHSMTSAIAATTTWCTRHDVVTMDGSAGVPSSASDEGPADDDEAVRTP